MNKDKLKEIKEKLLHEPKEYKQFGGKWFRNKNNDYMLEIIDSLLEEVNPIITKKFEITYPVQIAYSQEEIRYGGHIIYNKARINAKDFEQAYNIAKNNYKGFVIIREILKDE